MKDETMKWVQPKLTPEQTERMIRREMAHIRYSPKFSLWRYLITPFFNRRKYEKEAFMTESNILERLKKND